MKISVQSGAARQGQGQETVWPGPGIVLLFSPGQEVKEPHVRSVRVFLT